MVLLLGRIDGDDFHAKLMSRLGTLAKALG